MIRELKNPCTQEYKTLKTYVQGPDMPWYYHSTTVAPPTIKHIGEEEDLLDIPFYSHTLLQRPNSARGKLYSEITSTIFEMAYEVLKQILEYNDINVSVIYRLNFNSTCYSKNKKSYYHKDLDDIPHENIIIYMSKFGDGETYVKDGEKEILSTPTEDGVILFGGSLYHCQAVPKEDERRIVMVGNIHEVVSVNK